LFSSGFEPQNAPEKNIVEARLFPEIQPIDQLAVTIAFGAAQIIEQAPALSHHFEEAAARGMIFGVDLQVLRQLRDSAG
jgi:hypothetical protein